MEQPNSPFTIEVDADRFELRQQEIDDSGEFGATYTDAEGEIHSYAAMAAALELQTQFELELTGYSKREAIRRAIADKLERDVLPLARTEDGLDDMPQRLRSARQDGQLGIRVKDGKRVFCWDAKCGSARFCPDDAREEAMRLRRRTMPTAQTLRDDGYRFLYGVLTVPNSVAGELRDGMVSIFDRLKALIASTYDDGSKKFPEIRGALAVLEAPLGSSRDWNVHLNVIFAIKAPAGLSQFFDFGKLRQQWHWHIGGFRWIPKAAGAFEAALAELIKYPVAAMAEKSADHADAGSRAPAMLEWTGGELLEWWRSMRRFRRTRSYGVLYGAKAPEAEDMGPIRWVGRVSLQAGRYVATIPLLMSIPEDKFPGATPLERYESLRRSLAPGGIAGAGSLGSHIPRDALHSSIAQLQKM